MGLFNARSGVSRLTAKHVIELRSVVKTYRSEAGVFTALKGVDLTVGNGEFLSIIDNVMLPMDFCRKAQMPKMAVCGGVNGK